MRSAIGKARGLALRLSLVLEHLYWCAKDGCAAPPDVITEETLLAAAKFVAEYAMPMAERTYGDAACTALDRNTATLARWIKKERPDAIHVRNMQRKVRLPGLTTADTMHAACTALIEAGWLGQPAGGAGFQQRGTMSYPVSPRLLEMLSQ
jgi:putative DNA primase/helicase